jgi:hypothetical protein
MIVSQDAGGLSPQFCPVYHACALYRRYV